MDSGRLRERGYWWARPSAATGRMLIPFLVASNNTYWLDGSPANRLRTAYVPGATVRALHWNLGDGEVYTLTVAIDHTFFAGTALVLVHDAFPCPIRPDVRGQIIYPRDPLVQRRIRGSQR